MTRRRREDATADLDRFAAMLFDLDGVITRTASVHAAAWKSLFDEFLHEWSAEHGTTFEPFEIATDYVQYVDGRRRYDGVASFLSSRGIELPWGDGTEGADARTVVALGKRKDAHFTESLETHGVDVFPDAVALIRLLRDAGKRVAVVSASENCIPVLERAAILELFDVRVTGVDAAAQGLAGKPAPDTFLEAARRFGLRAEEAVVFEDALSGVEAGAAGGFGLVVGVDRTGVGDQLLEHGADVVVQDLMTLAPRSSGVPPRTRE